MKKTFHLIANAHLDPVWLWDWREGLNEGITTSRTILDLMDEIGDLTCIRGEAAVYRHIEEYDPATFARIRRYVAAGRWDVVGGTWVQPDMNLTGTETLIRHFLAAKTYFRSRFHREVTVAWAADAFGHSAGLPDILASAGMKGFAFFRPSQFQLPLAKPAFWWEGPGGGRVMAYRPGYGFGCEGYGYGCERKEDIGARLDKFLALALASDLSHVGIYYGLGNHGGGPTRRVVEAIREWADRHPEVRVVHSGLHRLFEALYGEVARRGAQILPVHVGELNFCLRGCYASVAKFKFAFRKTEALTGRAERTETAIRAALGQKPAGLASAWDALLFNSFHDILPGSSIERAYEDQLAWLGKAVHECQLTELAALNALAERVDTRVPVPAGDHPAAVPFLVWNPHPYEYRGPLELEACLDYRPIMAYTGKVERLPVELSGPDQVPLPLQVVATEHASFPELAWRKRVVSQVVLPPLGWSVFSLGWREGARVPAVTNPVTARAGSLDNGLYRVRAAVGAAGIQMWWRGRPLFGPAGLGAVSVEDPWGSWGGDGEEPASLDLQNVRHRWKAVAVETLEAGPERASLWVRLAGGQSRLDLMVSLCRGRAAVDVGARVLWNERAARLKLVLPCVGAVADFEVPGGVVRRAPCGEVPGGRWVRVKGKGTGFGFASDALYSFNLRTDALQATVVRASRYADNRVRGAREEPWRPAVDAGELRFRFLLAPDHAPLPRLAGELEQPPLALPVPPGLGPLPRRGSLAALGPAGLSLLALKPAQDGRGWILRARSDAEKPARAHLVWLGRRIDLGVVAPRAIATWRIRARAGDGTADRVTLLETALRPR